jgi:hypothetical protein
MKNEIQRCITSLFQTISNEERMQIEENESNKGASKLVLVTSLAPNINCSEEVWK